MRSSKFMSERHISESQISARIRQREALAREREGLAWRPPDEPMAWARNFRAIDFGEIAMIRNIGEVMREHSACGLVNFRKAASLPANRLKRDARGLDA